MKSIIGYKVGMTSIYDESGKQVPVSVVQVGEMTVSGIRTEKQNGYHALQIGVGVKKKPNKDLLGFYKKNKLEVSKVLREFRVSDDHTYKVGDKLNVSLMDAVQWVDVTGVSKGKGFQGGVRRYGFGGGRASHGGSSVLRRIGSIGQATYPGRVFKGKKMPGQMGNKQITVQRLKLVKNDVENGLILLKGAIPGKNGGFVTIKESVKVSK